MMEECTIARTNDSVPMSTLTFSGIGSTSRRTTHKRVVRAEFPTPVIATQAQKPLVQPIVFGVRTRTVYEVLALCGFVLLVHVLIAIGISQNKNEAIVVPPKVPPMEIQISKPTPLPQAIPVPKNLPPQPKKAAPPKSAPAPAPAPAKVASPVATPVAHETVAINPVPTTNQVATSSESQSAPARATGERVTQARADADYLNNPPPKYPAIAQSRGWEGQVMLNVHVLASGRADIINVEQSSGRKTLDDAAIKAVTDWRFVPAKRGQTPIDGWVQVPIDFKLGK